MEKLRSSQPLSSIICGIMKICQAEHIFCRSELSRNIITTWLCKVSFCGPFVYFFLVALSLYSFSSLVPTRVISFVLFSADRDSESHTAATVCFSQTFLEFFYLVTVFMFRVSTDTMETTDFLYGIWIFLLPVCCLLSLNIIPYNPG